MEKDNNLIKVFSIGAAYIFLAYSCTSIPILFEENVHTG